MNLTAHIVSHYHPPQVNPSLSRYRSRLRFSRSTPWRLVVPGCGLYVTGLEGEPQYKLFVASIWPRVASANWPVKKRWSESVSANWSSEDQHQGHHHLWSLLHHQNYHTQPALFPHHDTRQQHASGTHNTFIFDGDEVHHQTAILIEEMTPNCGISSDDHLITNRQQVKSGNLSMLRLVGCWL